jgi:predicted lipoprotein with Yx(FWY)xxD motif
MRAHHPVDGSTDGDVTGDGVDGIWRIAKE